MVVARRESTEELVIVGGRSTDEGRGAPNRHVSVCFEVGIKIQENALRHVPNSIVQVLLDPSLQLGWKARCYSFQAAAQKQWLLPRSRQLQG